MSNCRGSCGSIPHASAVGTQPRSVCSTCTMRCCAAASASSASNGASRSSTARAARGSEPRVRVARFAHSSGEPSQRVATSESACSALGCAMNATTAPICRAVVGGGRRRDGNRQRHGAEGVPRCRVVEGRRTEGGRGAQQRHRRAVVTAREARRGVAEQCDDTRVRTGLGRRACGRRHRGLRHRRNRRRTASVEHERQRPRETLRSQETQADRHTRRECHRTWPRFDGPSALVRRTPGRAPRQRSTTGVRVTTP